MYKSPIEIIYDDIKYKQEDEIYKAIESYNIHVDKDELLKALSYDRMQYEVGYRSGVIEFAEYLKKHSCSYDLDNYHSFDAIDIEDLDDLAEEFLDKKEYF